MLDRQLRCSRRKFLASAAALTFASGIASADGPDAPPAANRGFTPPTVQGRKPLAIVTTVYRPLSHSYHIAGRFLYGYTLAGQPHTPKFYIASLYADQTPDNDLSRDAARDFGVRTARTIADALLVDGKLAVEGVLLIGEHGNYPRNDKGQILYPRLEMMEEIAAAFRKAGRSVPVYNDKHLSYTFANAKKMIGWSEELKFPLMAGSSLPVTWRRPELELAPGDALRGRPRRRLRADRGLRLPRPGSAASHDGAAQGRRERRQSRHLPDRQGRVEGRRRRPLELGPPGRGPPPQRDGQPRRRAQEHRQYERPGHAAGAGHGVPNRVPGRLARHGAAAQRPRSGFLLRRPRQGRGQAGLLSLLAAQSARRKSSTR